MKTPRPKSRRAAPKPDEVKPINRKRLVRPAGQGLPPRPWKLVQDDAGFYIADRDGAAVLDLEFDLETESDLVALTINAVNAYHPFKGMTALIARHLEENEVSAVDPLDGAVFPLEGAS